MMCIMNNEKSELQSETTLKDNNKKKERNINEPESEL